MPSFDEPETVYRTALCARCETLGSGQWNPQEGTFEWRCGCTEISLTGITKPDGPGEVRVCTLPHRLISLRPCRRLLSMSRGRLWREVWRDQNGVILESGSDYVTIFEQDGRQVWSKDFSFSFTLLTGDIWRPEEGAE
jgi:hypothetical protein